MPLFIGASESYDTDAWEAYNLKKENAKLRQQLADVTESMGRVEERCAKLREQGARLFDKTLELGTENAKLRELVCMMLRVAGVAEYATDSEWQVVTDYLRELGIEVD